MDKRKQFLADKVIVASLSFLWVLLCVGCGGSGDGGGGGGGAGNIDNPPQISQVGSSVFSDEDSVYSTGQMVRIDIEESSGEADIVSGTIQITSALTNYDSGVQDLTFGSIFYHWDTAGLEPANDYSVEITLVDDSGQESFDNSLIITLIPNPPAINKLVSRVDMSVPATGIPVSVERTYLLDSGFNTSLGFGWTHSYLMHVVETSDGLVKVFNSDGSGSFFKPNGVATYESPKGDFRTLTKNPDGSFELKEKFGTIYYFNDLGRLISIADRNGNALALAYESNGLLETIADPSGQVTKFFYDADNRLSSITDPAGRNVSYGYDASGNLASFTNAGGYQTAYTYDSNRNLTTITDPAGRRTFFTVYADDRLGSVSGEGGNNKLTYEYETPAPDQMTITDALGNKTVQTYDNNALITEITDPLGNITSFTYDENFNMTSLTDGNGSTSTFSYDKNGNVLTSTDALGNTTTMAYEPRFNQMTRLTDSKGNITTFDYDANGNQTAIIYPDGSAEKFSYGASGNLLSKTDRMNQTINFNYDFRGRLTTKLFQDGTSDVFTYDDAGNLLEATDENGTIGFIYDDLDRPIEVNYPGGEVVSYAYDASSNQAQITYPDGTVLDYEYDDVNRLVQISNSSQMIARYSYDQLSRITGRDLANGNFTTYSYDPSGRLLDLINRKSDSEIISRFSYTYDNYGNRLTMTTLEGTTQYIYDDSNQLIEVVLPGGSTIIYNIDPAGNRNSVAVDGITTSYTTNNLNQYTDVGGDTYTYDANGNLASKTTAQGTTSYTYDFENRLVRVDTLAEMITYTYDPFGRRTSKTTSCCRTNYIYDNNRIIMETDDSGLVQATYIHGIGIDEVLVMNRDGEDYFYAQDGLGSVANLTDFSEDIIESFSYDPYGTPSNQSSVGNPYLFTGREFEPETNMYFYRARYYNPALGRFITTDPIGFVEGKNHYTYVFNNPINFVDPYGLQPPNWKLKCDADYLHCITVECFYGSTPLCVRLCKERKRECLENGPNVGRGDPTFIQASQRQVRQELDSNSISKFDSLFAKITVPCEDSIVRGDVPIFGLAYGKNFKEYRVEVGEGAKPTEWVTLANPQTPQEMDTSSTVLNDPGDWAIEGNMATWDTGLKNYVYLPSHPADHPVDLKGTYTIRLIVSGMDGTTVEDRVTVEVANVIPNAWGGKATSADGRAVLSMPEQAIMDSFRLISVKPADKAPELKRSARRVIGKVYELREAGEKFTKAATLQMSFSDKEIGNINPDRLGIYGYNSQTNKWEYLDSKRPKNESVIYAKVRKLYPYYALMASDISAEGSSVGPPSEREVQIQKASTIRNNAYYLVNETFEDSLGEWSNRDNEVGAEVTLDNDATFDGSKAIKITNTHVGGNFAVNVRTTPFDIREYPVVQFDYRIPADVKTNFLVKVSGRWYEIRFTDDEKVLANKRVNIAHIGDIEGIEADDRWHTARFNLYDMLRNKTGNTLVEEMIMADWDVGGYMKLQFGHNRKGATYFIDNFTISREVTAGLKLNTDTILVDNFNQKKEANALGGAISTFSDGEIRHLNINFSVEDAIGRGHSLKLYYELPQVKSYTGYITELRNLDLRGYQTLTFFIKGTENSQDLKVGLKDESGNESKVLIGDYLPERITTEWQKVTIPLVSFSNINDWGRLENLSLSFENNLHSKGVVFIDNVEFHKGTRTYLVDNFERLDKRNSLGRQHYTFVNGAAAINGRHAKGSPNGIYRITYGGNIGAIKAYASDLKSFAGWATELGGINCSQCGTLSFRVRGAEGGENPSIYLDDGNFRWGLELANYASVTNSWQEVSIQISEFSEYGVDLTHLARLQFVLEGVKMSGTFYLDDIRFEPPAQ